MIALNIGVVCVYEATRWLNTTVVLAFLQRSFSFYFKIGDVSKLRGQSQDKPLFFFQLYKVRRN